jgi:choline transport protein
MTIMEKPNVTEVSAAMDEFEMAHGNKVSDGYVMAIIGKKEQLVRRFGFLSILALSATLLSSWEAIAGVFYAGLYNGGPVSLVYGMILSFIDTLALASSIAEMASSTPIAGAQYHWTFTYAPKRAAVFLSWMQGMFHQRRLSSSTVKG